MPRPFSSATAEQVVAVVEAVVVRQRPADAAFVSDFVDTPLAQVENALRLAADIGLIAETATGEYEPASPLSRFLVTPDHQRKAAALRVMLESYEPFRAFRSRLLITDIAAAAQETKVLCDLDGHREGIKDTLISLGTYSGALVTEGAASYRLEEDALANPLEQLAAAASDLASAEMRIRSQLGADVAESVSSTEVIAPLAESLLKGLSGDGTGAVVNAGNAVESYLVALAAEKTVNIGGATGINAKLDRLKTANVIPSKLVFVGKYLGHIRNAADHGIDPEVAASWSIRSSTALEYPLVACSFIASVQCFTTRNVPEI